MPQPACLTHPPTPILKNHHLTQNKALESAIVETMKPWRPDQVLDVRYDPSRDAVELRWCPEEIRPVQETATTAAGPQSRLAEEAAAVAVVTTTTHSKGEAGGCELRWSGNLKERIG